ncbi:hypothetical protein COS31_03730 [Candidatus Roizmanbacteria bacterium CG02_land_8_20_14_3_00_36_15]|uniref:Solute-binding protein family 5 domain-containing protein n=1 Tax=Candidatus Roizmanbacteria bacterium CG10_big_fil_rev_8_21_14_0_10_36_26 TaxID=1974851 RepID=A0A2M8KMF0_9BACT|nr:MAG: hypothetical protein COS51_00135 [Candidatus Roizmanbacteria bacterium CG03_land_8_20_14_0_80_36_21]PIV37671.1 MAG: hypothetical protein COS31_03730 [Candidatus Roizmanbacteria bacterium CG02_land_8_20_14_3_00_36_15]PIY69793.1 MAG: hypothetical protein COY89_04515 [Candidatus Roizmanbacteria bacterium CG_4_10_14_0_8_um_filter_36_36]PJA53501.1 MAG: hypothetical protein CO166_01800 [Candidatus Roizmanbacteria bacterium CG_4_9_14_3_um_filter_36_11]PJE61103.1 MAG: hypothetical protein COU86
MTLPNKTFRYYYWLTTEFIKKNLKLILLTFFLTFVAVICLVSLYPFLESTFIVKKQIIGISGKYDFKNIPDEISNKISNGLIYIKNDGSVIPALASSWEIKNDGKEFLIHLKQNLIWNNGKKFTAKDINYQFNDVTVKIIDDYSLSFFLKNALPIFITYLNKPVIGRPLIGVGGLYRTGKVSFKNVAFKELYLLPNKTGLPVIIYKFYNNDEELVSAYKIGEINQFSLSKKTIINPFYSWKNSQVTTTVDYTRLLTLFFNFKNQLLKDKDIRSAIRMAINMNELKDFGQPANGPIPPISWAYNSNIKPAVYDLDTAKKIITNTIPATQSAQLALSSYYEYSDLSDLLANQLKSIGLNIGVSYLTQGLGENFDLLLAYWKIPEDPDQYYFWHSAQKETNIGNYVNLKIDRLLELGRNTYLIKERAKVYQEYQKTITEDPPALFLFYPYVYTVTRK